MCSAFLFIMLHTECSHSVKHIYSYCVGLWNVYFISTTITVETFWFLPSIMYSNARIDFLNKTNNNNDDLWYSLLMLILMTVSDDEALMGQLCKVCMGQEWTATNKQTWTLREYIWLSISWSNHYRWTWYTIHHGYDGRVQTRSRLDRR